MSVKLLVIVERGPGKRNFSCFATETVGDFSLAGYGASAREAMDDIKVSAQEFKEIAEERGVEFPNIEFDYRFDVGAFFDYYPLDVTAVAKYIGINASVLRQYATSIREPKAKQLEKIRKGLSLLANDLGSGLMISRPAADYIK